ncbi:serine/arginine repetitive matrix protein 2-like [Patiria miniata]|uniref:Uncharacterized protein n=1 Tax=Patiria miniata TaxID=46514 RepID=A0A914B0U0_PATMI|nr:serine/arginine repetitive matrix protein 2-like [Patiria miniata]
MPMGRAPSSHPALKPKLSSTATQTPPPRPRVPPVRSLSPHARPLSPPPKHLYPKATYRPHSPPTRPLSPATRPLSPSTRPLSPPSRPLSPTARPLSPPTRSLSPPTRPLSPPPRLVSPVDKPPSLPLRSLSPQSRPLSPLHSVSPLHRPGSILRPISPPPPQTSHGKLEIILPRAVKKCLKIIDHRGAKKAKHAQGKQKGVSNESSDIEKASKAPSDCCEQVLKQHRINRNNNSPTSPDKMRSRHPSDPSSIKKKQHSRLKFSPSDALFTVSSKAMSLTPRLFHREGDKPKCLPLTPEEARPPPQRPSAPPPRAPPPPLIPDSCDSASDSASAHDSSSQLSQDDYDLRTSVLPDLPIHTWSPRRAPPNPLQRFEAVNGQCFDPPHKPDKPPLSPLLVFSTNLSVKTSRISPCSSPSPPRSPVRFPYNASPRLPGRRHIHPPPEDSPPELPRRHNHHPLPNPPLYDYQERPVHPSSSVSELSNGTNGLQMPSLPLCRRMLPPIPAGEPYHCRETSADFAFSLYEQRTNQNPLPGMNGIRDQSPKRQIDSAFRNKSRHIRFTPGQGDMNHADCLRASPKPGFASAHKSSSPFLATKPLPPIPLSDVSHRPNRKNIHHSTKPLPPIPSSTQSHNTGHPVRDSSSPTPRLNRVKPLPAIPQSDSSIAKASSSKSRMASDCAPLKYQETSHQRHKPLPDIPHCVSLRSKNLNEDSDVKPVASVPRLPPKTQLFASKSQQVTSGFHKKDNIRHPLDELDSCPVESKYTLDNHDPQRGPRLRKHSRNSSRFVRPPSGDSELLRKMEKRKAAIELSISKASMEKKNRLKLKALSENSQTGSQMESKIDLSRKQRQKDDPELPPKRHIQNTAFFQYPDTNCDSQKPFKPVVDENDHFLPIQHSPDSDAMKDTDSEPDTSLCLDSSIPRAPPPPPPPEPPPLPPRETTRPPTLPPRKSQDVFAKNRMQSTDTDSIQTSRTTSGSRIRTKTPPSPLPRPDIISQRKRSDQRITSPLLRNFSSGIHCQRFGSTDSSPCQSPSRVEPSSGQSELMAVLEKKRAEIESDGSRHSSISSIHSNSSRSRFSPPVRSPNSYKFGIIQSVPAGESELMSKLARKREAIERAPSSDPCPSLARENQTSGPRQTPSHGQEASKEQSELMQKLARKRTQAESKPVLTADSNCASQGRHIKKERSRNPGYSQEPSSEQSELMQKLARKKVEAESSGSVNRHLEAGMPRENCLPLVKNPERRRNPSSSHQPSSEQSELMAKLERKRKQAESIPSPSRSNGKESDTFKDHQKEREPFPPIKIPEQTRNPRYTQQNVNDQSELMKKLERKRAEADTGIVSSRQEHNSSPTTKLPPFVPPKGSRNRKNHPLCLSPTEMPSDIFPRQGDVASTKNSVQNDSLNGPRHLTKGSLQDTLSGTDDLFKFEDGKSEIDQDFQQNKPIQKSSSIPFPEMSSLSTLPWRPSKKVQRVNFSPQNSFDKQRKRDSGSGGKESEIPKVPLRPKNVRREMSRGSQEFQKLKRCSSGKQTNCKRMSESLDQVQTNDDSRLGNAENEAPKVPRGFKKVKKVPSKGAQDVQKYRHSPSVPGSKIVNPGTLRNSKLMNRSQDSCPGESTEYDVPKVPRKTRNSRKAPSRGSYDFQKLKASPSAPASKVASPRTLTSSKLMNRSADKIVYKADQSKPGPAVLRSKVRRKPSEKREKPPGGVHLRRRPSGKKLASKRVSLKVNRNSKTLSPSLPQDSHSRAPCAPKTLPKPSTAKRIQAAWLLGSAVSGGNNTSSSPPRVHKSPNESTVRKLQVWLMHVQQNVGMGMVNAALGSLDYKPKEFTLSVLTSYVSKWGWVLNYLTFEEFSEHVLVEVKFEF